MNEKKTTPTRPGREVYKVSQCVVGQVLFEVSKYSRVRCHSPYSNNLSLKEKRFLFSCDDDVCCKEKSLISRTPILQNLVVSTKDGAMMKIILCSVVL